MSKSGTIIIVDDNKGVLTAVEILLKSYFSKVVTLSSPVTLITVMQEEMPEVILLDMNFTSGINTGNEGLFWLHEIKKVRPELPIVLFTRYPGNQGRSDGFHRETLEQPKTGRDFTNRRTVCEKRKKRRSKKGIRRCPADILGRK